MAKKNSPLSIMKNPKSRGIVVVAGALTAIGMVVLASQSISGEAGEVPESRTASVPTNIRAVPGNPTSERYRELQTQENLQRLEEAKETDGSAIPTIIGQADSEDSLDPLSELLDAGSNDDQGDLFGDTSRGGFIGGGLFNPGQEEASAEELRLQRLKEQRELLEQERLAAERQRDLERQRQLEAQRQAAYRQRVDQQAQKMAAASQAVFSRWGELPTQEYIAGELADADDQNTRTVANDGTVTVTNADGSQTITNPDGSVTTVAATNAQTIGEQEIIKAGSVLFAVLDTSINTDEPSPVLATIVHGKYKGAKLIGTVEHSGRQERLVMNFNVLSLPDRDNSNTVAAVAIDPDTARTALASSVDKHYLLRYGSLFAASFIDGYGQAVTNQGTTTVAPDGSTTTTQEDLSGSEQLYAALGKVGESWSQQVEPLFNKAYTVKVDQGTSIGILFTQDANVTD